MKATEIFESPQLTDPTDFNLNDESVNSNLADELLRKKKELIEDSVDYEIFLTGNKINGYICLINKHENLIDYLIRYKTSHKNMIGKTVTQVALWRKLGSPWVQGVTKRIFFNYLLQEWPAIVSDGIQTEDGMKFWQNRMAEATTLGYKVGLFNRSKNHLEWFDGQPKDFLKWLKLKNSWGKEEKFAWDRFIISN